MSWFLRLFSAGYRQGRRSEAKGDYRQAAAHYAEAGLPEEAANALLFLAVRTTDDAEREGLYEDALRWLEDEDEKRKEVLGQLGLAILRQHRDAVRLSGEDERRLERAVGLLEAAALHSDAATACEILGDTDGAVRNLQEGGDVDRLEALLATQHGSARQERALRRRLAEHEMAFAVGARREALAALREAVELAPGDDGLRRRLRDIEKRGLGEGAVLLEVGEERMLVARGPRLVLGRDATMTVRGASVSRRHVRLELGDGGVVLEDLGSRNGTLVRGVPLAQKLTLSGPSEFGLGEDVQVRVEPQDAGYSVEVLSGMDRGLRGSVGDSLSLSEFGVNVHVDFEVGPRLVPGDGVVMHLEGQKVAVAVELLQGDVLTVGGKTVKVLA